MADFTTPLSSRSTQAEHKWTVSPEFGDALLTAMRERINTGGPLPRLPSMLQLPSPEILKTPTFPSPTKPDSAERLKMKTRIAIRDRDPHRFQVVPLRDASKYPVNQKSSQEHPSLEVASSRVQGTVQATLYSLKGRVNENDPAPPSLLQDRLTKTITSERPTILSERNKNIPAQGLSSLETPVSLNSHVVAIGVRLDSQQLRERSKQPNTSEQCSNLSAKMTPNHNKLHFKSPSLGNLRAKPNLDNDLRANPLPRVTSCRKRTNTLSADHKHRPGQVISTELVQRPDRPNLTKKDSIRRHAIYTQSLYVPAVERSDLSSGETSGQLCDESHSLRAFPFRSSKSVNHSKFTTFSAVRTGNALGFVDVGSSVPGLHSGDSNSQSSIPSIYSQDEIYASRSCLDSSLHHPIILELLAEVEKAMHEWSASMPI